MFCVCVWNRLKLAVLLLLRDRIFYVWSLYVCIIWWLRLQGGKFQWRLMATFTFGHKRLFPFRRFLSDYAWKCFLISIFFFFFFAWACPGTIHPKEFLVLWVPKILVLLLLFTNVSFSLRQCLSSVFFFFFECTSSAMIRSVSTISTAFAVQNCPKRNPFHDDLVCLFFFLFGCQ